jgi:hypothetical protein
MCTKETSSKESNEHLEFVSCEYTVCAKQNGALNSYKSRSIFTRRKIAHEKKCKQNLLIRHD